MNDLPAEREPLDGLNFALHHASVLDLEFDPPGPALLYLLVTSTPKTGPVPVRARLRLSPVSALVVSLQAQDGGPPSRDMPPLPLDELRLMLHKSHPLQGFDFLDSQRDAIPRGTVVYEWFDAGLTGSAHTLSFYYGVRHEERGVHALLFYRILFDKAVLSYPDGQVIPISSFSPAGSSQWKALGGADLMRDAITVMPDPVPPNRVDGRLLGLIFVEAETGLIRGLAVGKASLDRQRLRWLSPDGAAYDISPELVNEIRPRLPDMSRRGNRLDGFDYWVTVATQAGESPDARRLVATHLRRSGSPWHRTISRHT